MGQAEKFTQYKLVLGLLYAEGSDPGSPAGRLSELFGPVDFESRDLPFDFTAYYRGEMGDRIIRRFISFRNLVPPDSLADIKIATNEIETLFSVRGNRRINLDPGILSLSRFLLATTKDNSHRIPLKNGIYAELTLQFSRKDLQVLPWTYPDYATREYRDILIKIREIYQADLKRGENNAGN